MAARVIVTGALGKRFVNRIWAARDPAPPAVASSRKRGVHASSYDKNEDEPVGPTAVPDNVIDAKPDKHYWGPHPTTGVFGPAAETGASSAAAGGAKTATGPSALDETVWYRPLEDVDKTPHA
ncbi:hypothetical protein OPV22_030478 [Ensete ventricosum]|uniref:Late embryogenesis abundant protein LEA-2 subgroup domain-containing protein n=1 Tax=Ensete ventricosum TaxID=4639 RepID=A0AAV8P739_ENSVE|nr:hypothetical protein OPV22_030478 [Ensete ventricosum]